MIEYRTDHDTHYLILPATFKQGVATTDPCPFCGVSHTHGANEGHRVAHCSREQRKPVTASDGTVLSPEDGYFIVQRDKPRNSIYEDGCPRCLGIVRPDIVYPNNDGFKALYHCDSCVLSWQTWYGKQYEEFISRL